MIHILLIPLLSTLVYFFFVPDYPWYYYLAFYVGNLLAHVVVWLIRKYT